MTLPLIKEHYMGIVDYRDLQEVTKRIQESCKNRILAAQKKETWQQEVDLLKHCGSNSTKITIMKMMREEHEKDEDDPNIWKRMVFNKKRTAEMESEEEKCIVCLTFRF